MSDLPDFSNYRSNENKADSSLNSTLTLGDDFDLDSSDTTVRPLHSTSRSSSITAADPLDSSSLNLEQLFTGVSLNRASSACATPPPPPTQADRLTASSLSINNVLTGVGLHRHRPPYSSPSVRFSPARNQYSFSSPNRGRAPSAGPTSGPCRSYRPPQTQVVPYVSPSAHLAQYLQIVFPPPQARRNNRPKRKMAPINMPELTEAQFLVVDSDIPELPAFPFLEHSAEKQPSAHITLKQHLVTQLQMQYESYNAITLQVKQIQRTPQADRDATENEILTTARRRLFKLYKGIRDSMPQLEHIVEVQSRDQPTLSLYEQDVAANLQPLRISEVKEFMQNTSTGPQRPLREIWNKLKIYAEMNHISHDDFKLALMSCTTAEVFEYISEYRDLPLAELAVKLADRFVTEQPISDANQALNTFSRKHNEPLRQAVARLQSLVDKALMAFPIAKREVLREHHTTHHLRAMITPKTRRLLDTKASEYRLQGLPLSLDDMIKIAVQEESRSGMPTADMSNPVSLYNIETSNLSAPPPNFLTHDQIQSQIDTSIVPLVSKIDNMSQNFDSKVDQIADLVHDMSEINLALVTGDTEPPLDDNEESEINMLTRSQYRQNPRTDAKTLTKPEPGNPLRQRNSARQQDRRAQYTGRFRNIADNIATQAAAQARPPPRTEPAPRAPSGPTSASGSTPSRPSSPAPSSRPTTPRPQDDRGRPRTRDDRAQVAQRYPSYAREVLQYRVPEPPRETLSPADYYKSKAQALQDQLRNSRQPSQPRNPSDSRPQQTPLPRDSEWDSRKRPHSGHRQPQHEPQYQHPLIPHRHVHDKPYFMPPGPTVLHTYDNTHVSINAPCVYCHSPVPHQLEDCYSLRPVLKQLSEKSAPEPSTRSKEN